MSSDTLLPLDLLDAGEVAEIAEVYGDSDWVHRLAEMGLEAGRRVRMIRNGSPCLLQLKGSQLCLRGDACSQILVKPCDPEDNL